MGCTMSELPSIRLNAGETEFDATPENSSLYMHLGHLAVYNHVFLEQGDSDKPDTLRGTYLFATGDWFTELAEFMASNGYPLHVNLRSVAKGDVEAFNKMVAQQTADIGDTVPDDWLKDEQ